MNDIQLYSVIMFIAGAALTRAVFYFDQKIKEKKFYLLMSASVIQMLDALHTSHIAAIDYAQSELKKIETVEEKQVSEYLLKEGNKVSIFMELYTLLLIKSIPERGRKYISFRNWPEACALIEQLRGLNKNGKNQS